MTNYIRILSGSGGLKAITNFYIRTASGSGGLKTVTDGWLRVTAGSGGLKRIFQLSVTPSIDFTVEISTSSSTFPATLTGTNYHWNNATSLTYVFQKSADNVSWSNIGSATSISNPSSGSSNTVTYALTSSDFPTFPGTNYYRFSVTGVNSTYGTSFTSTSSSVAVTYPTTGTVSLTGLTSGYAELNTSLGYSLSGWSSGLTYTQQWYRAFDLVTTLGTSTTQSVGTAYSTVGEYIYVTVKGYSGGVQVGSATSNSATIVPPPPTFTLTNNGNGTFTISNVQVLGSTSSYYYYGSYSGAGSGSISQRLLTSGFTSSVGSAGSYSITLYARKIDGTTGTTDSARSTTNSVSVTVLSVPSGGTVTLSPSGTQPSGTLLTATTSGWSGSPTSYNLRIYASTTNPPTTSSTLKASSSSSSVTYTISVFDASPPPFYFKAFATATNAAGTSTEEPGSNVVLSYVPVPTTAPTLTAYTGTYGGISYTNGYNFLAPNYRTACAFTLPADATSADYEVYSSFSNIGPWAYRGGNTYVSGSPVTASWNQTTYGSWARYVFISRNSGGTSGTLTGNYSTVSGTYSTIVI